MEIKGPWGWLVHDPLSMAETTEIWLESSEASQAEKPDKVLKLALLTLSSFPQSGAVQARAH